MGRRFAIPAFVRSISLIAIKTLTATSGDAWLPVTTYTSGAILSQIG